MPSQLRLYLTAKLTQLPQVSAKRPGLTQMIAVVEALEAQNCDMCGGFGHRTDACGLAKRVKLGAGNTYVTRQYVQGFKDERVASRRNIVVPGANINLPPAVIGKRRNFAQIDGEPGQKRGKSA